MREVERMEDELIVIWDTFGKKTRMNFLRTGAYNNLSDFGLGLLSGSKLHQAWTFAEPRTSSEPEALSGSEL